MISIVIPVFNASSLITSTVQELSVYLSQNFSDYEILLCDDSSKDGSREIMEMAAVEDKNVRLFYNADNFGLGATLRRLFQEARGECVFYCDCDLPFGCPAIKTLYDGSKDYDIIVASRYCGEHNQVSFIRRIFSRLYYRFCKDLFNVAVVDIGSGTVLFKKTALDRLYISANGFGVHVELFARAAQQGMKIKEIGMKSRQSVKSSFSIVRHSWPIFIETMKIYKELSKES
ncbi:MAG: glycosyltransferase family 2 protein [Candidatus Omnitrophica bacterium]|nr:glycosyltransferase family 2 protein [Candidatus Omnitrophota bacterium]